MSSILKLKDLDHKMFDSILAINLNDNYNLWNSILESSVSIGLLLGVLTSINSTHAHTEFARELTQSELVYKSKFCLLNKD